MILHGPVGEDAANQENEGDEESVYTYSEEALHAQVAQLQLGHKKDEDAEAV